MIESVEMVELIKSVELVELVKLVESVGLVNRHIGWFLWSAGWRIQRTIEKPAGRFYDPAGEGGAAAWATFSQR